jgi:hypothetical protein
VVKFPCGPEPVVRWNLMLLMVPNSRFAILRLLAGAVS